MIVMPKGHILHGRIKQPHLPFRHGRQRDSHLSIGEKLADAGPRATHETKTRPAPARQDRRVRFNPSIGIEPPWVRKDGLVSVNEQGRGAERGAGWDGVLPCLAAIPAGVDKGFVGAVVWFV